jgi:hypothetical protein
MTAAELTTFFERYRDDFNRLDGDAVANRWHVPSGIADAKGGQAALTWWTEDAPMRANHRALCAWYRNADYGRADFVLSAVTPMGPHHAHALVRWTLTRTDGSLLQAFATGYHVMRNHDGLRVLLCTAFEEDLQEMKPHVAL